MLFTKADGQRDELATVISQTKLTALATLVVDMLWQKVL